jgi:hypothetical protein
VDRFETITDAEVAVVLIARVDGAGRESDGTPVIVEHRTGTRQPACSSLTVAFLSRS